MLYTAKLIARVYKYLMSYLKCSFIIYKLEWSLMNSFFPHWLFRYFPFPENFPHCDIRVGFLRYFPPFILNPTPTSSCSFRGFRDTITFAYYPCVFLPWWLLWSSQKAKSFSGSVLTTALGCPCAHMCTRFVFCFITKKYSLTIFKHLYNSIYFAFIVYDAFYFLYVHVHRWVLTHSIAHVRVVVHHYCSIFFLLIWRQVLPIL